MGLQIQKNGHAITTVDEWFHYAPPKKGLSHWKDCRSAKELATSFLASGVPTVPDELQNILELHSNVNLVAAFPEHKIKLDLFRGGTTNADIAAYGNGTIKGISGTLSVTIEAKADESFGPTIGEKLLSVRAKLKPKSNVPKRIDALWNALYGCTIPRIDNLRYQLLCGVAASLIFAREQNAVAAIFLVMEFHNSKCKPKNIERNKNDFEALLKTFNVSSPVLGQLYGPFQVTGGGFVPDALPLFIGKIVRRIEPVAQTIGVLITPLASVNVEPIFKDLQD